MIGGDSSEKSRLTWVDAIKGLAIIFIVALHCGAEGLPHNLARFASSGTAWVQLFLIFTVVLSCNSLDRQDQAVGHSCGLMPWKWWWSRFVRLAPVYYVALGLAMVLTGGCKWWLGTEQHITGFNLLAHVLFVHGFFPHYVDSILSVEWYLGVVAQFLLLAPLLHRYVNTFPRALGGLVVAIIFEQVFREHILMHLGWLAQDDNVFYPFCEVFCFSASLPTIVLGLLTWRLMRTPLAVEGRERAYLAVAMYGLFAILYHGVVKGVNVLHHFQPQVLMAIMFIPLIVALRVYPAKVIDNPVLRFLGRHSYGIYLFHMVLMESLCEKSWPWVLRFGTAFAMSIVVTLAVERLLEKPLQRYLLRK